MNLVDSLEGQLRLKDFKLNSLLDITTAINSNQNVFQSNKKLIKMQISASI